MNSNIADVNIDTANTTTDEINNDFEISATIIDANNDTANPAIDENNYY